MKVLLFSFLTLLFGYFGLLNGVRDGYLYLMSPIQYGLSTSAKSLKDSVSFYFHLKSIYKDYEANKQELLVLNSRIAQYLQYKQENDFLKSQLNIKIENANTPVFIIADVLGNPEDISGGTIFINKGTANTVAVGDSIVLQKYLIGEVIETTAFRSKVRLITSPDFSATAFSQSSETHIEGIVKGKYGTSLALEKILQSESLNISDVIVTSGRDGKFIPGLIIGTISSVESSPSDTLKSAILKLDYNISEITKVFVLKSL